MSNSAYVMRRRSRSLHMHASRVVARAATTMAGRPKPYANWTQTRAAITIRSAYPAASHHGKQPKARAVKNAAPRQHRRANVKRQGCRRRPTQHNRREAEWIIHGLSPGSRQFPTRYRQGQRCFQGDQPPPLASAIHGFSMRRSSESKSGLLISRLVNSAAAMAIAKPARASTR